MKERIDLALKKLLNYRCNPKRTGVSFELLDNLEKELNTVFPLGYKIFLSSTNGGTYFESEEFFSVTPDDFPDISIKSAIKDYSDLLKKIKLRNPIPVHNGFSFHVLSDGRFYEIGTDDGKVKKVISNFADLLNEVIEEYKYHYEEISPTMTEDERLKNLESNLETAVSDLRKRK